MTDALLVAPRHARHYRIAAAVAGVAVTSAIGSVGVVAAYYPLRHAGFEAQWLLVFLLMVGESAAVHLPSEVILPVGGWLVVRDHSLGWAGILGLSVVAGLGNTVGSLALYAAGNSGGRPLVRRLGRYVLVHERDVDAAELRMARHRAWALFVARVMPVVRTYVGFVAGLLNMPVAMFIAVTFAGSVVWSLAFVALGSVLGSHWSEIRGPAEVAGIAVIVALLASLTVFTVRSAKAGAG